MVDDVKDPMLGVDIDAVVVEQLEVATLHDDGYSDSECCWVDMCIVFNKLMDKISLVFLAAPNSTSCNFLYFN